MTELNISEKNGDTSLSETSSNNENSGNRIDDIEKDYHVAEDEESQVKKTHRLFTKYKKLYQYVILQKKKDIRKLHCFPVLKKLVVTPLHKNQYLPLADLYRVCLCCVCTTSSKRI
jgi:hypothetical protein